MSLTLQLRRKGAEVKEQEEYTTPEQILNNDPEMTIILPSAQFVDTLPNEADWVVLFPFNGPDMMYDHVCECVSSILVQSQKPFLWSQRRQHTLSASQKPYE